MKIYELSQFKGGWVVGDFVPTILNSKDFEVAVKSYPAGFCEPKHHHKIAEEITVIASGKAKMQGVVLNAGSIVHLAPSESSAFEALEATITVVVKRPSVPDDKYLD